MRSTLAHILDMKSELPLSESLGPAEWSLKWDEVLGCWWAHSSRTTHISTKCTHCEQASPALETLARSHS